MEITAQLQAPFGWRVAAEQDEAGVYFVVLRRAVIGALAAAIFYVTVPLDSYLMLKLDHASLTLEDVAGEIELLPPHPKLSIVSS